MLFSLSPNDIGGEGRDEGASDAAASAFLEPKP